MNRSDKFEQVFLLITVSDEPLGNFEVGIILSIDFLNERYFLFIFVAAFAIGHQELI